MGLAIVLMMLLKSAHSLEQAGALQLHPEFKFDASKAQIEHVYNLNK